VTSTRSNRAKPTGLVSIDSSARREQALLTLRSHGAQGVVLCVDEGVILHDERTLDTCVRLLGLQAVESVGCLLVSSQQTAKGVSLRALFTGAALTQSSSEATAIVPIESGALFPRQTFLVAAQDEACFMTKLDENQSRHASGLAPRHVFTTRVAIEVPLCAEEGQASGRRLWAPMDGADASGLLIKRLP
jgi:hypothetical protein